MDIQQQFVEEIKTFGESFLQGFGNDFGKATNALQKSNEILKDNPRIIPMLANEENQKQIGEIIAYIGSGKGDIIGTISKVQKLAKKLKF